MAGHAIGTGDKPHRICLWFAVRSHVFRAPILRNKSTLAPTVKVFAPSPLLSPLPPPTLYMFCIGAPVPGV